MSTLLKKNAWPWLSVSVLIILFDQWSKYLIQQYLSVNSFFKLTPFLNFILSYNTGAAFNFLSGHELWRIIILIAVSVTISLFVLGWLLRSDRSQILLCLALSLILGGAIGNLIDRIRLNHVIDFIDFHLGSWHFATFNVADSAISIGAAFLVIQLLFIDQKKA